MSASAFSPDYTASRARFRSSAGALNWRLEAHPIGQNGPDGDDLTIDVAMCGSQNPRRAVVVSSGTHGVEGFFGAAVQAALLEETLGGFTPPDDMAIVFIHAINPYGFAHIRRVNEDNVDQNRNFLLTGQPFSGCDDGYRQFDPMLNPPTPPGGFDPFLVKAAYNIVKHGMPALKNALVSGQYEFDKGLFFGGRGPTATHRILADNLGRWVNGAENVVHVDFHTGMGKWGTYVLAVDWPSDDPKTAWLKQHFGEDRVQALDPGGVLYEIRGVLGTWCQSIVPETNYCCMLAEFGTRNVLEVITALREENRATHWGADDTAIKQAKKRLKEAFAPASIEWRTSVVRDGVKVVQQAIEATLST